MPIEEEHEGEETHYRLTPAGYQQILGWIRFQVQMCELEHGEATSICDDETHQIAFMMTFVVVPLMDMLGLPTSIEPLHPEKNEDEAEDEGSG